jgi:predicted tellurium resistance membrane protein TerC
MTKCLPFSDRYDEDGRLFIVEEEYELDALENSSEKPVGHKTKGSLLLLVVLVIQVVDLIFAVDSVTAKISQYDDIFINFSSSAFAMLCLRSCYYIIRDMVDMFKYLKFGVAAILFFIGVKLMIAHWIEIEPWISLMVILLSLVFTVVFSFVAARFESGIAPMRDDEDADKSNACAEPATPDERGDEVGRVDGVAVDQVRPEIVGNDLGEE